MALRKKRIPRYGTVQVNGHKYYRTDVEDAEGKRVILYGKTREELYDKEMAALEKVDNITFRQKSPTVAEYCEKWLLMQSVHIRNTTLTDYTSKVRRHIIKELGQKRMAEVTLDDIQVALVPVSKKSVSVYKSVIILYKSIFRAAQESHVIDTNPTIYLNAKGGGIPQEDKQALTDEQAERLLDAIQGLPPYVFVMIGLYAGLRREEILALQWDSVYLDTEAPYLTVRRAWHTEHNRPIILTELKTKAAERNIPLPDRLADCLREAKKKSTSEYVIANRDGEPLSYTQFKRLWQYIVTRTAKPRVYYRYENGKRVKHTVNPVLGEKAAHNGKVIYSLDFDVTPHQLRHTYITNLIHSSVDPKTVQYLAGHESSKITMDIYAKVKYNKPDELAGVLTDALAADVAAKEQRTEMPLSDLHPFEGHPFKVLDDELMEQTVESIKQIGVVSPLIVRPDPEGGFEILSGHRRLHAAQLAGLETVPVIVKEMDDDAAIIFMVDSNLQRENILPSERAFSYKMKLDAMKHQGNLTVISIGGELVPALRLI